jgi:type I restriction-modification system DNA methylase subunit
LNFLINEHQYIDELEASLFGGGLVFRNIENTILENNIFGVDINEESVEIAKLSLWLRTAQPRRKLNDLSSNIKCGNSLNDKKSLSGNKAFNWEEEFVSVFENGGFDVIVGNPPYGAHLNDGEKAFYSERFATFQGNHEIYFFFIELVSSLIKDGGHIGYITPDTWVNIPQAQRLRQHVLDNYGINTIVAFDYPVFSDASVNALIFSAEKSAESTECKIIVADDIKNKLTVPNSKINYCSIERWSDSDDQQFQIWQNEQDIRIIEKIRSNSAPGIQYLDVCQGIVPYSTEHLSKEEIKARIYHGNTPKDKTWGQWVQGRAVRRYGLDNSNAEYLNYGDWLHRPRKPKYFSGERILIQEITGGTPPRISATIYSDTLYHDPGIISCINISELSSKYLLALINSSLMSWYVVKTSPKGKRKTFPKVLIGDIRNFPIVSPETADLDSINNLVDEQIDLTHDLTQASSSFLKYLISSLELVNPSRKLLAWYDLTFKEFLVEITKIMKKNNKEKLSKSDELEWMEIFEDKKRYIQGLNSSLEKNDSEIDCAIAQVYGLTEEEKRLIDSY